MGQVFKSGPSKTCGRQHLKKLTWSTLEYLVSNKVAALQSAISLGTRLSYGASVFLSISEAATGSVP